MEWHRPEAFYLILPLSLAWLGLALYARSMRRRAAAAFVSAAMQSRIMPAESGTRFWLRLGLWEAALIFAILALAGPRYGSTYEIVKPRGTDLYVLIDVSRSMLAEDVAPTRLGRAKADVASLLNKLNGERVGLIAFAGKAVVKCPLTTDYNFLRTTLDELDPNSAPRGGTAIGDAIRKALEVFAKDADRDKSILLITDGDDQQSYPMEAAAAAAQSRVAIFAVGLGDATQGGRVPAKTAGDSKTFAEYEGQQVWSKLDNSLLSNIAVKTGGVYVPAGTRHYDLAQLYESNLKGRRGGDAKEQKRVRLSEQFQIALALTIFCLIAEMLIRPYAPPPVAASNENSNALFQSNAKKKPALANPPALAGTVALLIFAFSLNNLFAAEETKKEEKTPPAIPAAPEKKPEAATPTPPASKVSPSRAVSEGLAFYAQDKFDEARDKFAQADASIEEKNGADAAIAAFDLAAAYHRKGDTEKAREQYLRAGLAHDKAVAAEAHYNLGCLHSENGRALAGEKPEEVAPEKRQEIVVKLMEAAGAFRHTLTIKPDHIAARRNLELLREWIKYHEDRWRMLDREKRRKETNLIQFLDFMIQAQNGLREGVKELKPNSPRDIFAQHKRAQDDLLEEIEPLKEKIKTELTPPPPSQPGAQAQPAPQQDPKQIEEGIKLLTEWANAAAGKMQTAASRLGGRQPPAAATEQKNAVIELEHIWEAVVPFQPLLARDLKDQTLIASTLKPDESETKEPKKEDPKPPLAAALNIGDGELTELTESQEKTQRWTALLKLKAEAELKRAEQMPPQPKPDPKTLPPAGTGPDDKTPPGPPDPEKIKEGLRKAIELAPKAADEMGKALAELKNKKRDAAYPPAEEARKILEEISKAQPKDPNQQKQEQEEKQDQQKQDQQKKEDEKKDEKKDQKDKDKKEQEKKEKEKEKQEQEKQEQASMSKDQLEEMLRKVREREKQKHEKDKKGRAYGTAGVDKDW